MTSQPCPTFFQSIHAAIRVVLLGFISVAIAGCCDDHEFKLHPLTTAPSVAVNGSGEGYTAWGEGGGGVYIMRTLADGTLEEPIQISPTFPDANAFCLQTSQPQITSNNQTTIVSWISFAPTADYKAFDTKQRNPVDLYLLASVITNGVPSSPVVIAQRSDVYTCNPPKAYPHQSEFLRRFGHQVAINDAGSAMIAWAAGNNEEYFTRFFNGTSWENEQQLEVVDSLFQLQAGSADFMIGSSEIFRTFQYRFITHIYDSTGTVKSRNELATYHQNPKWFINKANDIFLTWLDQVDTNYTLNSQKYSSSSESWGARQLIDSYPIPTEFSELTAVSFMGETRYSISYDSQGKGLLLWQQFQDDVDSSYHLVECTSDENCTSNGALITNFSSNLTPAITLSPDGQAASVLYVSDAKTKAGGTPALLKNLKLMTSFGSPLSFSEEVLKDAYVVTDEELYAGSDVDGSNYHGRIEDSGMDDTLDVGIVPKRTYLYDRFRTDALKNSIALDDSHTTLLAWPSPVYHSYAVTIGHALFKATTGSIAISKNGEGQVSSDIAGIDCGADCIEFFPYDTEVVLTATPDTGSRFIRWTGTGDCTALSGDAVRVVSVTQNSNCVATFEPLTPPSDVTLTLIILGGPGAGEVNSLEFPMPVMQCLNSADPTSTCTAQYPLGSLVFLESTPFFTNRVEWTGCDGITEGGLCELTLDQDRTITATYSEQTGTVYSISASSSDATKGDVVSVVPSGITGSINCPSSNCADLFTVTTSGSITLEARPKPGSIFASWGAGQCDSESRVNGVGICTMNLIDGSPMTTTRRADAQFF